MDILVGAQLDNAGHLQRTEAEYRLSSDITGATMTITIAPSPDACGAEVSGISLAGPMSASTLTALTAAFAEYGLLVFRNQVLGEADQVRFTAHFGELDQYVLSEYRSDSTPEVMLVSNIQHEGRNIGLADAGTTWHTDSSYLAIPPHATVLYAREVPERDSLVLGDTLFASAAAAYDALSDSIKARLDGLNVIHSYAGKHQARAALGRSDRNPPKATERKALAPVTHPLVRTHPVSGRKALYASKGECVGIEGMEPTEALALIDQLSNAIVEPANIHRHRWQLHDLVIWDNCQLQHLAIKDYALPLRRMMHRTQVKGTPPV
jgi:taurine dioxygenase